MNNNTLSVNYNFTPPPVGLDKITLHTREFEVKDTLNLFINGNAKEQGKREVEPQPLFRVGGDLVTGSKAWHNAEDGYGNLAVEINWKGLAVRWNPSKLAGKYTGELATLSDVSASIPLLEKYLLENGILLNLSECKLSRLDLAKDREMSDRVRSYATALSSLDGKRMKERVQYPDGVRIGTQTKQGIFYDKGLELKPKEGSTNNMRGEFRLLKGKPIQATLGISKLGDLTSLHQQDISTAYANYINADLYRIGNADQLSFSFTNEVDTLRFYRTRYKRNAILRWLLQEAIQMKMELIGDMETLSQIIREAGFTRQAVYNAKRMIETELRQSSFNRNSHQTLGAKREEIRQRFVA